MVATAYCPGAGAVVRRRPVVAPADFAGRLLPKDDADDDRRFRREAPVVLGSAFGPDVDTTSGGLLSVMETTTAVRDDPSKRAFLGRCRANASTNEANVEKQQIMTTNAGTGIGSACAGAIFNVALR